MSATHSPISSMTMPIPRVPLLMEWTFILWRMSLIAHMQEINSYRQVVFSKGSSRLLSYGSISRFISRNVIPTTCYPSNTLRADYECDVEFSMMPSQIPSVISKANFLTYPSSSKLWCINEGERFWCCGEKKSLGGTYFFSPNLLSTCLSWWLMA